MAGRVARDGTLGAIRTQETQASTVQS
jgi:hypothetical protein